MGPFPKASNSTTSAGNTRENWNDNCSLFVLVIILAHRKGLGYWLKIHESLLMGKRYGRQCFSLVVNS